MTQQDAERQIADLARQLGVKVSFDVDRWDAYAIPEFREIHLAAWDPVTWQSQYWSALHELGHVADDSDKLRKGGDTMMAMLFGTYYTVVEAETGAWNWAFENALPDADRAYGANIARTAVGNYVATAPPGWERGERSAKFAQFVGQYDYRRDLAKDAAPPDYDLDLAERGWSELASTV